MNVVDKIIAERGVESKITPSDIALNIVSEFYFTAGEAVEATYGVRKEELSVLTFCVLVLENGFTVTGESACASPANFDPVVGKTIAKQNATQKIWQLMGYELKSKLSGI